MYKKESEERLLLFRKNFKIIALIIKPLAHILELYFYGTVLMWETNNYKDTFLLQRRRKDSKR